MNNLTEVNYARPFIKWLGGKSQLLSSIQKNTPSDYNSYFEPFVGSGAVFFNLIPQQKKAYINDINCRLIGTYLALRDDLGGVLYLLHTFESEFKNELFREEKAAFYYRKRDKFNSLCKNSNAYNTLCAALFIFLNKTCFNGVYRENSKGHFNVPFGERKNYAIFNIDNLRAVSSHLKGTKIHCSSYSRVLGFARKGDFVYLDPPYYPLSKTSSFTKYYAENFLSEQQLGLKKTFDKLSERGCKVMMSNSDTTFIEKLYSAYNLLRVNASRTVNCKSNARGKISELLIKNY